MKRADKAYVFIHNQSDIAVLHDQVYQNYQSTNNYLMRTNSNKKLAEDRIFTLHEF